MQQPYERLQYILGQIILQHQPRLKSKLLLMKLCIYFRKSLGSSVPQKNYGCILLQICLVTFISFISFTKVHLFISCIKVQLIHFVIHFHLIHFTDHSPSHSHSPYLVLLMVNLIVCFIFEPISSLETRSVFR